jgi:glycosyltransferase involved in cell wall biosynthesis
MRILHLMAGELSGGAARGAYWLHTALREQGVNSTILCNARDIRGYDFVDAVANSGFGRIKVAVSWRIGRAPIRMYRRRADVDFNTGFDGIDITRHPAYAHADLVHLHWVNGLVGMRALRKIKKPVLWTLRDMWPMTGGCHQSLGCERYRESCGKCPQLGSNRERDLTRLVVRRKERALPSHMRVVGMSHWLSECARQSTLFGKFPVATIANNVDTQAFTPLEKLHARQALGIEDDRRVLLVGAQDVASAYKGFDLFLEALGKLDRKDVQVLLFGKRTTGIPKSLDIPSKNLGFLKDIDSLRFAYSAADVFVAPSRADAFGKTLVEAMACGTPVVCFDATGPKDIVEHRVTGYKAEPYSASDLAVGIDWILDLSLGIYQELCDRARIRAEQQFDSRVIARQYIELYRDCMASPYQRV